jgi:hypothetical protein
MSKGRMLTELRQSHAAGIHDSVPARSAVKKQAILQDMEDSDMSEFDGDYVDEGDFFDDFDEEPSDEDLDEIENEDHVPADFDPEDYPHESQVEQLDPCGLY